MTAADFRLAWRLQRWEIVVLVGGSLLMAAAMAAVAWQLAVNRDAIAACYAETGPSLSADCRSTIGLGNFLGSSVAVLVGAATVAPFAVGVLIGAPLLSREIEHRTAPMAWSLAQSRRRWLVGRVLHVRDRGEAPPLVVLDAGMTELIRPVLYGAHHPITALTSLGRPVDGGGVGRTPTRVDGPICEATDTLGLHPLPPLRRGDLVAIAQAGAYADSMAMTYNGRPRPPVVLIGPQGEVERVRRRSSRGR